MRTQHLQRPKSSKFSWVRPKAVLWAPAPSRAPKPRRPTARTSHRQSPTPRLTLTNPVSTIAPLPPQTRPWCSPSWTRCCSAGRGRRLPLWPWKLRSGESPCSSAACAHQRSIRLVIQLPSWFSLLNFITLISYRSSFHISSLFLIWFITAITIGDRKKIFQPDFSSEFKLERTVQAVFQSNRHCSYDADALCFGASPR